MEKPRLKTLSGPRVHTLHTLCIVTSTFSLGDCARLCSQISADYSRSPPTINQTQSPRSVKPYWTHGAASQPSIHLPYPAADWVPSPQNSNSLPIPITPPKPAIHDRGAFMRRDYFWLLYFGLLDFVPFRQKRKSLQQQLFYT